MTALTVLRHPTCLATKRFSLIDGKPTVTPYGQGKYFSAKVVPVVDLVTLATAVHDLQADPFSFVVRGEPIGDLERIRRTIHAQQGDLAGFREVPRQWVMLDVDGSPGGHVFRTEADCERAVLSALERLPENCRTAACYWQLSSSAGMKPGVSCHFWFWLDRPMGQNELVLWAESLAEEAGRPVVDAAVFRTVQPHYTAAPVFDFVNDPVTLRCGFREGTPELSLPDVRAPLQGLAWKKKLAPLYAPTHGQVHPHVLSACASYFLACGPEASDAPLVAAIREATEHSCRIRGIEENTYTAEVLREHVESGRAYARRKQGVTITRDSHGEVRPTQANVRAILASSPDWDGVLGFDERKDRPVILRPPPFAEGTKGNRTGPAPRDYDNEDDARIVAWLAEVHGVHVPDRLISSVINVIAKEHAFDPVEDYLRGLAWDGVSRVDSWLADYVGVPDSRYSRRVGAMWLISAVARALEPGCKVDTMLVLEGPQGAGKSSLLRELCGGLRFFREGIGDIRSVETLKEIAQAWIVEVRELGGLKRGDNEAKKAFIDRQNDHYRGSYDRRPTDHLRRCVFAATTNEDDYLHDATGGRRYLPVRVGEILLEELREVRDQLWAEARERYQAGEAWHYDATDEDFVEEQRDRSLDDRDDPWAEKIAAALDKGSSSHLPSPTTEKIPARASSVRVLQISEHVFNNAAPSHADTVRIARAMRILGWLRRRRAGRAEWSRAGLTAVAEAC